MAAVRPIGRGVPPSVMTPAGWLKVMGTVKWSGRTIPQMAGVWDILGELTPQDFFLKARAISPPSASDRETPASWNSKASPALLRLWGATERAILIDGE